MNLAEIKTAVEAGKTVHWSSKGYRVIKDTLGQWFIICDSNQHCIGLTWRDEVTLNGKEEDFYTPIKMEGNAIDLSQAIMSYGYLIATEPDEDGLHKIYYRLGEWAPDEAKINWSIAFTNLRLLRDKMENGYLKGTGADEFMEMSGCETYDNLADWPWTDTLVAMIDYFGMEKLFPDTILSMREGRIYELFNQGRLTWV